MNIPEGFEEKIGFGLYGGEEQFFVKGVDGTVAELGSALPPILDLIDVISAREKAHEKLMRERRK
jgi:hypothetical protein